MECSTSKDNVFLLAEVVGKVGIEDLKPAFQDAKYSLNTFRGLEWRRLNNSSLFFGLERPTTSVTCISEIELTRRN